MKDIKITIQGAPTADASVLVAALANMCHRLGVRPALPGADLNVVGRLVGDEWTLNQELGKLAKADDNGIPGFACTIEVKAPGPDAKDVRIAELEKAIDIVSGHVDTPEVCRQIIREALGIEVKVS